MIILLISFFLTQAQANSYQVLALRGEASFQGKPLSINQEVSGIGEVKTSARSWLRLKNPTTQDSIILGASSKLKLPENEAAPELNQGSLRWVSGELRKDKTAPTVRTPSAVFGVRGTDFLVSYGPLLAESQIVCFDGIVNFSTTTEDAKDITKGQWGGVGGRFGKQVGNIADLPKNVLDHFQGTVPLE
jgi:hypothetical protein